MGLLRNTDNSAQRYDRIVEEATRLFVEQSFEETTMQDIAERAGVGIENLYKYFTTKRDLFFTVALSFWNKRYLVNEEVLTDDLSGIQSVEKLIDEEIRIFFENTERYVFLEKFDNYVKHYLRKDQINDVKQVEFLERYERACKHDESVWKMVLLSGLSDHSIRSDVDMSLLLHTLSIMTMSVFQKFANRRVIIDQDDEYKMEEIIIILKKMIMEYLKA